ncbi:MAG TPA: FAD-linked oxidase C-terminal domain-containing protein [Anaerolineales bacterium]|nr:FAD-linked oxidase C-terminal domain-containing protein [Anaerolineales bacterium]HNO30552.1 FAD-linked oxidase C-terminal domain-containing protein [Anaerolineales bacterium]
MTLSQDFIQELKPRFKGDLRLDRASKILYSTDASAYQIEPLGVAIPESQDDLQAAVELAVRYKIPILPRGSGSSLAGQAIGEALILDCSRHLDAILEIDPAQHYAVVEPGVVLSNLNRAAAKHGLMFGPDPASAERATLGGVIGNNATGAHSILYGMSADHLLEADVILGDGTLARLGAATFDVPTADARLSNIVSAVQEIRKRYAQAIQQNHPRSWRNSAGYRLNYLLPWSPSAPPQWDMDDYGLLSTVYRPSSTVNLAALLAGSEGTLAVMRRLKVNLVPKPKHTILGVLAYASIAGACDDVPRLLAMNPSAVELIPQLILHNARSIPAYARQMGWVVGDPAAVLVVEFSGDQPSALKEAVRRLGDVLTIAESPEEQARIWNVRKVGLGILDSRPQSARPIAFIEDCAIPVERLGDFVREVERILSVYGTYGGIYAHASAGCLHIRPVLDLQKGEGVRAMRGIVEEVFALTMSLGGSMSSEHGDGLARGEFIERTYGSEVTAAMRLLKQAFDPHGLLNPKKMFDAPLMDSSLRYGETYQAEAWQPVLHFNHERGLAGAIEMCNGQGVCRKTTGVMCPSFQATREEGNSTRGRANLLRGLMSSNSEYSNIRHSELESATFSALDLCLACKGCTSECPSGVDMPKLKYEFMNAYYKSHRRRLRDYLFGYFHVAAKLLSPFAPLANWFMRMKWPHAWMARVLDISEQRPFPAFAKHSAPHVRSGRQYPQAVIFLSDVFSHYIEPEVETAAVEILDRLGYEVKILPVIGAGASLLSKGFLDAARRHADKVLAEISRLDGGAGLSVVGCEPPEVYCLKHEYASLLPERGAEIRSLARRVWLVDEFILRVANPGQLLDLNSEVKEKVTLHPHCHQRAEGPADDGLPSGVSATVAMLQKVGYEVEVIEAGCCGMAGTFGYDAEHYDLSMQVGELGVLPKVRDAEAAMRNVVSTGAACRMQIQQGAGVDAVHPLLLVRERLSLSQP